MYRVAQEGLPLLLPAMSKQLVRPTAAELLRLLTEQSIALPPDMRSPMESLVSSFATPLSAVNPTCHNLWHFQSEILAYGGAFQFRTPLKIVMKAAFAMNL